jgi:hypothetical protein
VLSYVYPYRDRDVLSIQPRIGEAPLSEVVAPSLAFVLGLALCAIVAVSTAGAFAASRVGSAWARTRRLWYFQLFDPHESYLFYELAMLFSVAVVSAYAAMIAWLGLRYGTDHAVWTPATYVLVIGAAAVASAAFLWCGVQTAISAAAAYRTALSTLRAGGRPTAAAHVSALAGEARRGLWLLGCALTIIVAYSSYRYLAPFFFDDPAVKTRSFLRMTHPINGLTPIVPIACVTAAMFVWAMFHLRRLKGPPLEETVKGELMVQAVEMSSTGSWQQQLVATLRGPTQGLPTVGILAVWIVAAVSAGFIMMCEPATIEARAFTVALVAAWIVVQVIAAVSIAQVTWLWHLTRAFLTGVARHHLADSFRRIARSAGFAQHRFSFRPPVVEDLVPLLERRKQLAAQLGAVDDAGELRTMLSRTIALDTDPPTHWTATHAWTTLLDEGKRLVGVLDAYWTWSAAAPERSERFEPLRAACRRAEELIAMELALVVRELLSRVMAYLMLIVLLLLLMVMALGSFPIHPKQPLLELTWVFVTIAVVVGLMIVVTMERDPILSRLAGTRPNRVTWDAEFMMKLALYGLVPLMTLFATQFPDVGNTLLHWIGQLNPMS